MKKNNKKCIVCGEIYTYCNSCSEFDKYPRWMGIYHEENCKNVFDIVSKFLSGHIDKEEAKEALSKCDLSNKKNFHKAILDAVNKIMASDKKRKKEPVVENIEEVKEIKQIENVFEQPEEIKEMIIDNE